jgi:hypothetical protein
MVCLDFAVALRTKLGAIVAILMLAHAFRCEYRTRTHGSSE